jgi:hypothetical protein
VYCEETDNAAYRLFLDGVGEAPTAGVP